MKFTSKEKEVLNEVRRRLNEFHGYNHNLDTRLLMLAFPSEVKSLIQKKILVCSTNETARVLNWYRLTKDGKKIFENKV